MSTLVQFVQYVSQPALAVTNVLADAIAMAGHRPRAGGDSIAAVFAVSAGIVSTLCVYWAGWAHARLGNLHIAMRMDRARAEAAIQFRDALLNQANQSIIVLRSGDREPQYYGEAYAALQACRGGQDGPTLAEALEGLVEMGTSFVLPVQTQDNRPVKVRGLPISGRAVLYFQEEAEKNTTNFREILDALPMPVWLHEKNQTLAWGNAAFLHTLGVNSVADIPADMGGLEWSVPEISHVPDAAKAKETRRHVIVEGQRRTFSLNFLPLHGDIAAGVALDITASAKLEMRLCLELDAQVDTMERLATGIAIFDAGRRLVHYNSAYARLWGFAEAWLDSHPSQDEILDRLRDNRKLPEQRNFTEWKQEQLLLFEGLHGPVEAFWHLPGGRSLQVVTQPHLAGGIFILFEDVSEKLRLEATVTLLTQVQRATLETIDDGIAIFGTDGRLILHNSRFAKMWRLTEGDLSMHPHFADIATLCTDRVGRDGIWGVVSCGLNSAAPERVSEWSKTRRADGKLISLSLSRLPNGATVVTFTDLTDLERFDAEQKNPGHVAA